MFLYVHQLTKTVTVREKLCRGIKGELVEDERAISYMAITLLFLVCGCYWYVKYNLGICYPLHEGS